jgi:hypothetical protein
MIIQIEDTLISTDIITEKFCCDLTLCKGQCCIEGDAGAPITLDEIEEAENNLDAIWQNLSASAQAVIDAQGVAYTDIEGETVTSIVNGKDCVFTCYKDIKINGKMVENCCLCAFEAAYREGKTNWYKPISCALYPIREKKLKNNMIALTYNQWSICKTAVAKGEKENIAVYQFLKEPLITRFGYEWYKALEAAADEITKL